MPWSGENYRALVNSRTLRTTSIFDARSLKCDATSRSCHVPSLPTEREGASEILVRTTYVFARTSLPESAGPSMRDLVGRSGLDLGTLGVIPSNPGSCLNVQIFWSSEVGRPTTFSEMLLSLISWPDDWLDEYSYTGLAKVRLEFGDGEAVEFRCADDEVVLLLGSMAVRYQGEIDEHDGSTDGATSRQDHTEMSLSGLSRTVRDRSSRAAKRTVRSMTRPGTTLKPRPGDGGTATNPSGSTRYVGSTKSSA